MISVRFVLTVLALAFTGYLVGRGLFWTHPVPHPVVFVLAMVMYLAVAWLCVLWGYPIRQGALAGGHTVGRGGDRLPLWVCALALVTAFVLPPALAYGVGPDAVSASYSSWFIGGLGALMVVLIARGRPWPAWSGTAVMAGWSAVLLGFVPALGLGLVGSVMWVTAAQFFVYALDRADRDTQRLGEIQRSASAVHAAQGSQQRERRIQVQRALAVAGPILARTIATGGHLGAEGQLDARIAEGRLRDELRGPRLLDDGVREVLDATRRRGAVVTLLDEGGLEDLGGDQLAAIRAELAATLRDARSDRLFVRTARDSRVAVTVVGRASSALGLSDEDSVDLWREIERPPASAVR